MGSKGFFKGALILSVSGLIVKIIGALYRIPLARLIGSEGMGLYQLAYPVYAILLTLSTAGIPVAISILVAEKQAKGDHHGGRRIFRLSLTILSITGLFFALILILSSRWLADSALKDPRVYYALITIAPAIVLTSICSSFRGYFQGNQNMVPTAVSQIVEQIIRVGTVLILAYLLLPKGLEFAAAGATFGAVTGGIAALTILLLAYIKHQKKSKTKFQAATPDPEPLPSLLQRMAVLALPISIGGLVVPIMQVIDALIIKDRLQAIGYSFKEATALYGNFSGMANTLINIAPIITISISVALVPIISEAMAKNDQRVVNYRVNQALWSTFLIGFPSAAGLWVLATPICVMLYKIPEVGPLVAVLTPSTLLLGLYQTTRGTLQGMGKTYLPVINLAIGIAIKGSLNYILVAIPFLNIQGAGIATVAGFSVAVLLNFYYVKKYTDFQMNWQKNIILPLGSSIFMILTTGLTYNLINQKMGNISGVTLGTANAIGVTIAIMVGILSYTLAILLTGGVKANDLRIIPAIGPKLADRLDKFKYFKS